MGLYARETKRFSPAQKLSQRINNLFWFGCSPIGEIFRARLRQFPALVNCCTIDWFSEWPEEALQSVAQSALQEMGELEASDDEINGMVRD